jgi:hypothetical protein
MINFSNIPVLNSVQRKNLNKLSFKASVSQNDSFVKSKNMKSAWVYKTPVRNPMIRAEFEKLFFEDTHYPHDGRNGDWYIKEERKGNETLYYASEKHPAKVKEIRVFGKKGKIVKNAGSVAKFANLKFDKDSNTYLAQPIQVKTKDGYKNAKFHYVWVDEQAKMFLKTIKFEEIS